MREKIDEGWQFKVYDLGDKVEKIPKTKPEVAISILAFRKDLLIKPIKFKDKMDRLMRRREKGIDFVKNGKMPEELIADTYVNDRKIIQEKVRVLEDVIEGEDENFIESIIDQYTEFMKECWKYGFSEISYNFTINHGLDSDDILVLFDLGELTFSKNKIEQHIEEEFWLEQSIYRHFLPESSRDYFKKKMREQITLANLEENWRKELDKDS